MKKLLLFTLTFIFVFSFLTTQSQSRKEKKEIKREKREKNQEKENDEYDSPEIRDRQAADMMKDPALGYVPYQRMMSAIDHTENLKKAQRASNSNNLQIGRAHV